MTDSFTVARIGQNDEQDDGNSNNRVGGDDDDPIVYSWIIFGLTLVAFLCCFVICLRSGWCIAPEDLDADERRRRRRRGDARGTSAATTTTTTTMRLSYAMMPALWTPSQIVNSMDHADTSTLTREQIRQALIQRRVLEISSLSEVRKKMMTLNKDEPNLKNVNGTKEDSEKKKKRSWMNRDRSYGSFLSVFTSNKRHKSDRRHSGNNIKYPKINLQRTLTFSEPLDYYYDNCNESSPLPYRRTQSAPTTTTTNVGEAITGAAVNQMNPEQPDYDANEESDLEEEEFPMDTSSTRSSRPVMVRSNQQQVDLEAQISLPGSSTTFARRNDTPNRNEAQMQYSSKGVETGRTIFLRRLKSNLFVRTLSRVTGGDSNKKNALNDDDDDDEVADEEEDPMGIIPTTTTSSYSLCDICLLEYEVGDHVAWSPNDACPHAFHTECITEWLLRHPTCPLCRNDYCRVSSSQ